LPEANDVIGNAILDSGARAVNAIPYVPPVSPGSPDSLTRGEDGTLRNRYPLEVLGTQIMVESPIVGRHQLRNIALAIAGAVELRGQGLEQISAETIARGVRETRWPGRFEVVAPGVDSPEYVLDVAHNPAGAWALRSTLSAAYPELENGREITMIFGAMRDKSIREMTEILFPVATRVVLTQANNPRSANPLEIRQAAARVAEGLEIADSEDVESAMETAQKMAGARGLVVVTGSIYIVGEAMRKLGIGI
jgi:dihydrofolate synthase / folylpolyglutamate synthase